MPTQAITNASPASLPAQTKPRRAREQRISPRVRQAVALLASGRAATQAAAARAVGLNEEHLCRMLKRATVRVFYEREVRETLARGQMRATARIMELIDAQSEHVSLDAATRVLGINGIRPPDQAAVNLTVNVQPGYVIDLRQGGDDMAHVRTIEAKPLTDKDDVPSER